MTRRRRRTRRKLNTMVDVTIYVGLLVALYFAVVTFGDLS